MPKLDNGIYVIKGSAQFYDYDFDNKSFRLKKVRVSSGRSLDDYSVPNNRGIRRDVNAYFQGSVTPPIIEPIQDMVLLNHTTYRSTDRFLSRLSRAPYDVKFAFSESEAEQLKEFFSDRNLKVHIVSELVNYSDRAVRKKKMLVFEHNVLCYIVHNGKKARIQFYENSDIDNRSKDICNIEVNRAFAGAVLEQANMRPSFSVFPEDSITKSGERVRSNLKRYY